MLGNTVLPPTEQPTLAAGYQRAACINRSSLDDDDDDDDDPGSGDFNAGISDDLLMN